MPQTYLRYYLQRKRRVSGFTAYSNGKVTDAKKAVGDDYKLVSGDVKHCSLVFPFNWLYSSLITAKIIQVGAAVA